MLRRANGCYKVPITAQELRDMTPESYVEITSQPRIRDWEIAKPTDADGMYALYKDAIKAWEMKKAIAIDPVSSELLEKLGEYDLPCKLAIMSGVDRTTKKTAANNYKAQTMALLQDWGLATEDDVETYAQNNFNEKHSESDLINHVKSARTTSPKELTCGLMLFGTGVTKAACKYCKANLEVVAAEAKRAEAVAKAAADLADKQAKLTKADEAKQAKAAEAVVLATAELAAKEAELEQAHASFEAEELEAAAKLENFVIERNGEHAKVIFAGKVLSMHARYVTELVGENYETHYKHDFESLNELMKFASHEPKFMVGEKWVNRIAAWANHKSVRAYREVKFEPYNTYEDRSKYIPREGCYNLWQGYAVTPLNHQISYPYLMRLCYQICEGRSEWIKYLFDWIAIGFQKPQSKVGVALCIRGGEGSGKGSLLHFLRKLWGSHGGYVSNGKQVTGNFNAHLMALCFLFADEAIFAGDKAAANAIKSLITEEIIAIERKGFDVTQERNYLRIAMASNHDWMIDASKDARRFCIFDLNKIPDDDCFFSETWIDGNAWVSVGVEDEQGDCESMRVSEYLEAGVEINLAEGESLEKYRYHKGASAKDISAEGLPVIQAKQFYKELHLELNRIEIKEQFLFDMLNRDVSEFVPNKNIPQTRALKEQKLHTLSGDSIAMWLLQLLNDDDGVVSEFTKEGNFIKSHSLYEGIPNKLLYDNYNAYCKKVDVRGFKLINPVHFSRDLTAKGVKSKRTSIEKSKYVEPRLSHKKLA